MSRNVDKDPNVDNASNVQPVTLTRWSDFFREKGFSIDYGNIIGKGSSGTVFSAVYETEETPLIAKLTPANPSNLAYVTKKFKNECDINEMLGRFSYFKTYPETKQFVLVTNNLGVELKSVIKNNETLQGLSILNMMALAMRLTKQLAIFHQADLVHFDVKLANIVVKENLHHPRLIDFDLSEIKTASKTCPTVSRKGTPRYIAPEWYSQGNKQYFTVDPKVDVFSLGVCLLEILSFVLNKNLFRNFYKKNNINSSEDMYSFRKTVKNEFTQLIQKMKPLIALRSREDRGLIYKYLEIIKGAVEKDPAKRSSLEDIYRALCQLRFTEESWLYKDDPDGRERWVDHNVGSKNGVKREVFYKVISPNSIACNPVTLFEKENASTPISPVKRKREEKADPLSPIKQAKPCS